MAQNVPMRLVLLLIALASACAAQAQVKQMVVRPPADDRDERDWRDRERREQRKAPPAAKMSPPASKPAAPPMMVVRPAEPQPTPPSKAEQMQRRMEEDRRIQRGEQATSSGNFRCSAYPVCDRSSGSYGSCRGVEQLYSAKSARFAREQVVRECAALNRPDNCNCASQCSRVAQCGPI
jgi:hypothetical protein